MKEIQEFKVGDYIYSECPNTQKEEFRRNPLIGKILEIDRKYIKVEVDIKKYSFYTNSEASVWCYDGFNRLATREEITGIKLINNYYFY